MNLLVKTVPNRSDISTELRALLARRNPNVPVGEVRTLDSVVQESTTGSRSTECCSWRSVARRYCWPRSGRTASFLIRYRRGRIRWAFEWRSARHVRGSSGWCWSSRFGFLTGLLGSAHSDAREVPVWCGHHRSLDVSGRGCRARDHGVAGGIYSGVASVAGRSAPRFAGRLVVCAAASRYFDNPIRP
jgi:hypothetical protein